VKGSLHLFLHIVTYVRFPWLNDVSTATMDGRFLSYTTILVDNNGNNVSTQCKRRRYYRNGDVIYKEGLGMN
jgi:hypothetical protein